MFSEDLDHPLVHGGGLVAAQRLFTDAPQPFIDLSTGINPYSYPLPQLPHDLFTRLPDPELLAAVATIAARSYGAPSPAHVVPAPGTQVLLPLVAALLRPSSAAVVAPTYREHARAAALAGHRVAAFADLAAAREAMLVIVTNPNNPNGRLFDKNELIALAKRLATRGGFLVVDEAFMEVGPPDASLAGEVGRNAIVVLRSFGKFFGLAGIRLGFALAAPPLAARLSAKLQVPRPGVLRQSGVLLPRQQSTAGLVGKGRRPGPGSGEHRRRSHDPRTRSHAPGHRLLQADHADPDER